MGKGVSSDGFLHFLIFVSFCSLCMIAVIAMLSPRIPDGLPLRPFLVGSVFSVIAILGMSAAVFPRPCSDIFYTGKGRAHTLKDRALTEGGFQKSSRLYGVTLVHGHHRLCPSYRNHEFQWGEKTFCRACMGLFFGALLSIVGAVYFLVLPHPVEVPDALLIMLGVVGVGSSLLRYVAADTFQEGFRFSFNVILIVGMFLLLVGVDARVQSLTLSCFVIGLCVFWVFTRVSLSNAVHEEICRGCAVECDG